MQNQGSTLMPPKLQTMFFTSILILKLQKKGKNNWKYSWMYETGRNEATGDIL